MILSLIKYLISGPVGLTSPDIVCRYTDSSWRERDEDKSLEGLLTLARREMEQEKQLKKVSRVFINSIS